MAKSSTAARGLGVEGEATGARLDFGGTPSQHLDILRLERHGVCSILTTRFVLGTFGRVEAVLRRAEAFEIVASEKGATLWVSDARGWASWARGLLTKDAAAAIGEPRAVINAKREREERQTLYAQHRKWAISIISQHSHKDNNYDDIGRYTTPSNKQQARVKCFQISMNTLCPFFYLLRVLFAVIVHRHYFKDGSALATLMLSISPGCARRIQEGPDPAMDRGPRLRERYARLVKSITPDGCQGSLLAALRKAAPRQPIAQPRDG